MRDTRSRVLALVVVFLVSACSGTEPVVTTTTIAFDVPGFETWQEWADWRMHEMGLFDDPVLACVAAAGWKLTVHKEGHWEYHVEDDQWDELGASVQACERRFDDVWIECLSNQGWVIGYNDDGSWYPEIATDRWPDYVNDAATCQAEVDTLIEKPGFATGELSWLYAALVESHTCIARLNYDIDPPPPLEEWMATFHDPAVVSWDPFALIPPHRFDAITAACAKPLR